MTKVVLQSFPPPVPERSRPSHLVNGGALLLRQQSVYENNLEFSDRTWKVTEEPRFEFTVPNPADRYNLYYNVRNSLDFPYARMFVTWHLMIQRQGDRNRDHPRLQRGRSGRLGDRIRAQTVSPGLGGDRGRRRLHRRDLRGRARVRAPGSQNPDDSEAERRTLGRSETPASTRPVRPTWPSWTATTC